MHKKGKSLTFTSEGLPIFQTQPRTLFEANQPEFMIPKKPAEKLSTFRKKPTAKMLNKPAKKASVGGVQEQVDVGVEEFERNFKETAA